MRGSTSTVGSFTHPCGYVDHIHIQANFLEVHDLASAALCLKSPSHSKISTAGQLPHPEGVCACGPRLPPRAPLQVSLGSSSSTAVRYMGSEGLVCPEFWNIYSFSEICAIISPQRQFGYKKRRLSGLNSGREVSKPFLDCGGQGCRIISFYPLINSPNQFALPKFPHDSG